MERGTGCTVTKSHKGKKTNAERRGRMLSAESKGTMFERRFMQFPSRTRIWKQMRGGDEKNNRPLQPLKRRHRLTGRYPPKVQAVKVKALLGQEAEYRAKIFREESARIRHVTCGTPCVTITSLNPARMVKNENSDMLRWPAHPKVEEKFWKTSSCLVEGVYTIRLCISRFLSEKTFSTERKLG